MIYQINKDYYVKVGNKFVKLSFTLDNKGELIMTPINSEKLENKPDLVVKEIKFEDEKSKIIESLTKTNKSFNKEETFSKNKSFGKGRVLD